MYSVLAVCLGNICRSPLAQGIIEDLTRELPVRVESAGTSSYHRNSAPDPRSTEIALRHGIQIGSQRSRPITSDDFEEFDLILAMDRENQENCRRLAPTEVDRSKVVLFLQAYGEGPVDEVPDPYHGRNRDFEYVYELLYQAANNLARELKQRHGTGRL